MSDNCPLKSGGVEGVSLEGFGEPSAPKGVPLAGETMDVSKGALGEGGSHPPTWRTPAERRLNRAMSRAYKGFGMGGGFKMITFTTSTGNVHDFPVDCELGPELAFPAFHYYEPEPIKDIHECWRKLVKRLRRRAVKMEYFAVKERNKRGDLEHLHVLWRGTWVDYLLIIQQWQAVLGRPGYVLAKKVKTKRKLISYLVKYLTKFISENIATGAKTRGYWYAYAWVFRRWAAWTKSIYSLSGEYLGTGMLRALREKELREREYTLLWIWSSALRAFLRREEGHIPEGLKIYLPTALRSETT